MSTYRVQIEGLDALKRTLGGLVAALSPGEIATAAAREVVVVYMPKLFKTNGFGTWPALKLRAGQPMSDTGRTRDAWSYRGNISDRSIEIANDAPFAWVHDKGMIIRARRKVMIIPNPNYWGNSERRTMTIRQMLDRVKSQRARAKYKYLRAIGKAKDYTARADARLALNSTGTPFFFARSVVIPERAMTRIRPEMQAAGDAGALKAIQIAVKAARGA